MSKILLIDDEPDIVRVLSMSLRADGYDVIPAHSGAEGIEVFEKERPDIVLTDIKMPGIDGYHLLKKIKEINADTRVVLMSGYSNDFSIREAIELGADEFIVKPFRGSDIIQVLEAAAE